MVSFRCKATLPQPLPRNSQTHGPVYSGVRRCAASRIDRPLKLGNVGYVDYPATASERVRQSRSTQSCLHVPPDCPFRYWAVIAGREHPCCLLDGDLLHPCHAADYRRPRHSVNLKNFLLICFSQVAYPSGVTSPSIFRGSIAVRQLARRHQQQRLHQQRFREISPA